MEFSFSEDQRAVADLAADVFSAHGSDDYNAKFAESEQSFDAQLWEQVVQTGLVNLVLSTDGGGSGLGMTELGLVLEQQGKHLAVAPLWQHQLVSLAIETHGSAQLRLSVLPAMASGEKMAALATELEHCASLQAMRSADGWVLSGNLDAVLLDDAHAWLLLAAATEQGPRLFLVAASQDGMTKTSGALTDMQPLCDIAFDNVSLSDDSILDADAIAWLEPRMDLCITSLQLGVLTESLHRTAIYSNERHQFGRPIGSFQALAVRAADAYIEVELLRSAQWQLAWRLDNGLPATAAGRVAKHHAALAGHIVGHTAQHIHGGVGADLRYPIHRFYLKSQALAAIGGGAEEQLARIGRELARPSFEEYIHD